MTVTTYDMFNQPRVVTEKTSAGTLRTTTITYDGAGRAYETTVAVAAGLGTAVPVARNVYDQATGQMVRTQSVVSGSVTAEVIRAYDTLGRQTSYTDADGNVSTTTYDLLSRTKTTSDGKAQRTYTYDGGSERRGLLTSVDDTQAGVFSGSYDADGNLVSESWPNGVQVTTDTDETGSQVGLTYVKPGCAAADCTLYTESVTESVHGQWRERVSSLSEQSYTYDQVGRLTSIGDIVGGQCTTRAYGLSTSSNRNSLTEYAPASDGSCQTTTAASSRTWTYDTADRVNTAGYVYDALGRTKTVPAADTASPAGGNVTVTYHGTDLVDTITQGGRTTDYTLDVTGERVRSWTDNASGSVVESVHHYDGDDDSPSWTQETASRYTRPLSGLSGMAGIFDSDSGQVDWQITSLHGDLVAEIHANDEALSRTSEATEYGTPRNADDVGTQRYGWLGAKQRAADTPSGIVLMGVRLYNTTTGRFLQIDPVYGGNANPYDYCSGDPINCFDLDGRWGWKSIKRWGRRALDNSFVRGVAVSVVVGAVCVGTAGIGCAVLVGAAAGAALGTANWYVNHRRESVWKHAGRGALLGAAAGGLRAWGAGRYATRYAYQARHAKWIRNGVARHRYYGRYSSARKRFSVSNGWAAKTIWNGVRNRHWSRW